MLGEAEAVDADGNAAIDRDLGQHRTNLVGRKPIGERAAHVGLEFLHLPERRNHAEIEDRALARGQRIVTPGLAPAVLCDDALEVAVEVVDVIERAVDIVLAQHRAALGETAVVHVLVHHSSSFSFSRWSSAASRVSVAAFENAAETAAA